MTDLDEIAQLLRSIDDKLSQVLDPPCQCGHMASEHSPGAPRGRGGVCLARQAVPHGATTCLCEWFQRA